MAVYPSHWELEPQQVAIPYLTMLCPHAQYALLKGLGLELGRWPWV